MSTDFRGLDPKGLPLVSIVAVSYNHERFLEETLDSIKVQTYPNIQLIVMDDCSQDKSVAKIEEWIKRNKVNCKFIAHEENQGLCKTLNEALEYCDGKYYELIACDDFFKQNKTSTQVNIFEKLNNDYGLVYSDVGICDENGEISDKSFYDEAGLRAPPSGYVYLEQCRSNFIKAMSVMIRMKSAKQIGLYDENLVFEDVDFFLRLAKEFKFYFQNEITGIWRRHEKNMTNELYNNPKYLKSRLIAYLKHFREGNKEVDNILRSKIKTLLILLKKSGSLNTTYLQISKNTIIEEYGVFFYYLTQGYMSYKVYYTLSNLFSSLKKTANVLFIPEEKIPPSRF